MEIFDGGKPFDFGKTSADYAKYRDIYPEVFYKKITDRNLCISGQNVLDIGTGTGVIPRNMYRFGAKWTGTDISENQIEKAKELSEDTDIEYLVCPTEKLPFAVRTFDVITACQCFAYFDHTIAAPILQRILKDNGKLLLLHMAWLPFEDPIAIASEKLVLKYSPNWTGNGALIHPINIPDCYFKHFTLTHHDEYRVNVHFTRESWHGRMRSCRGIGASLLPEEISHWEAEHIKLLQKIAPEEFDILHYAAIAELTKK